MKTFIILCCFFVGLQAVSQVWIGTSPFCGGSKEDCDLMDLDYLRSDKQGDGKFCMSGQKVLCQVRGQPSPPNGKRDQLTVISYNIFERPFSVTHDGQQERTCHIPRMISTRHPDVDVLVVQEGFLGGCFPEMSMRRMFQFFGLPYATKSVGSRSDKPVNGGVFLLSRWPILEEGDLVYKNTSPLEADMFSAKGVIYAKINKLGVIYHIFGTHLQAQEGSKNEKVRVLQAGEFRAFIDSKNISPTGRVIIAGDFNCDWINNAGHVRAIMTTLKAVIPPKIGVLNATYSPSQNDVVEPGSHAEWLDYTVYSTRHAQPKRATLEGLLLRSERVIEYCNSAPLQPFYVSPKSKLCSKAKSTREMSDHFPVKGVFNF